MITVEAIAVETIAVEMIALETITVEAIAVETITVHPGGVNRSLLRQSLFILGGSIDDHC